MATKTTEVLHPTISDIVCNSTHPINLDTPLIVAWQDEIARNGFETYVGMWKDGSQNQIERLVFVLSHVLSMTEFLVIATRAILDRDVHYTAEIGQLKHELATALSQNKVLIEGNRDVVEHSAYLEQKLQQKDKETEAIRTASDRGWRLYSAYKTAHDNLQQRVNELQCQVIDLKADNDC